MNTKSVVTFFIILLGIGLFVISPPFFMVILVLSLIIFLFVIIAKNNSNPSDSELTYNSSKNAVKHSNFSAQNISHDNNFSCPEEAYINHLFREFLLTYNSAQSNTTFVSRTLDIVLLYDNVKSGFNDLLCSLPRDSHDILDKFFCNSIYQIVKTKNAGYLIFTPAYILQYQNPQTKIELYQHSDLDINKLIYNVQIQGNPSRNDEIHSQVYLHPRKDGGPDLRYSYNPLIYRVYRGIITLNYANVTFEIELENRTRTSNLYRGLTSYDDFIYDNYEDHITKLLSQSYPSYTASEDTKKTNSDIYLIKEGILTSHVGDVNKITIPNSVSKIGTCSFFASSDISSVILNNELHTIDDWAFAECKDLKSVHIQSLLININDGAFSGCLNLTDIKLNNNLKSIGWGAFYGCNKISTLTVPKNVTIIGEMAFAGWKSNQHIIFECDKENVLPEVLKYCNAKITYKQAE